MKVGLSIYHSNNYGSILTNFALYNLIQSLGHTPIIIKKHSFFQPDSWRRIYRYYNISTSQNDKDINNLCDEFVVGSDCSWGFNAPWFNKKFILDFLLSYTPKKKISISPSIIKDTGFLKDGDKIRISNMINNFDFISVRDDGFIPYLKDIGITKNISWITDPTLLVDTKIYDNLIAKSNLKRERYNLMYILNWNKDIENLSLKFNNDYEIFLMKDIRTLKENIKIDNPNIHLLNNMNVYDFLYLMKNADKIITDSYHGTIFSLLFKKPVISIKNRTIERFDSLHRIIKSDIFFDKSSINNANFIDIDYKEILKNIYNKRIEDVKLIKSALS